MTRGLGTIDAIRALLPDPVLAGLAAATHLGDVAVLVAIVTIVYWFHDRRTGAFALAATIGGLAIAVGLKGFFALPRPPESLWLVAADGYGFPSGHALGTTVTFGALALGLEAAGPRRRAGVSIGVVGVVGLVSFSRVAIGVHYAVDVLAGVVLGAVFLAVLFGLGRGDPLRGFAIVYVVAAGGVALSGATPDAIALLGAAMAGLVVWRVANVPEVPWGRDDLVHALGAGGFVGGTLFVGLSTDPAAPVAFVLGAVAVGVVVGVPALHGDRRVIPGR